MEQKQKCPWYRFHKWIYLGPVLVVESPEGPFDPRTDRQRTSARWKHVCAKCGTVKLRKITDPDW